MKSDAYPGGWHRIDTLRQAVLPFIQESVAASIEETDAIQQTAEPLAAPLVDSSKIPPQLGERLLLLILSKAERVNIPGDLEEEFAQIAEKHGKRFAKIWYWKQVGASAWPLIWKGLKWGVWTSIGAWIRRIIQE